MVSVTQQGDGILFTVQGLHKVWAFKNSLTIPRAHIAGARQDPEALQDWWKGWRVGTHVSGLLTAGTFFFEDKRILGGDSPRRPRRHHRPS